MRRRAMAVEAFVLAANVIYWRLGRPLKVTVRGIMHRLKNVCLFHEYYHSQIMT